MNLLQLQLEPSLLMAWSIAATSLSAVIYLLLTWPNSNADELSVALRTAEPSGGTGLGAAPMHGSSARSPRQHPSNIAGGISPRRDGGDSSIPGQQGPSTAALRELSEHLFESDEAIASRRKQAPVTLKTRVIRAGIYQKSGVRWFQLIRLLLSVGWFAAGQLVVPLAGLPWSQGCVIGAMLAMAGYLLPSFWLDARLRRRQTAMRRALPDALDLITACMQGGLSLPGALGRVSRELGTAHPTLAIELSIVEREIQMGRTIADALRQFANRFDLEELRSLASVVGQAERFGGSISGALKTYAEGLRMNRRQRAEEMAQQAAVKLLFPTILCIFPGIFVVILGPTAIRVYQIMVVANPWGK